MEGKPGLQTGRVFDLPRKRPLRAPPTAPPSGARRPSLRSPQLAFGAQPAPRRRNHFSRRPGGIPAPGRQSGLPSPPGSDLQKTTDALEKIGKRKFPLFHAVSPLRRYRSVFSAPQFSLQVALNGSRRDETGRVRRHFVCVRGERALRGERGAAEGAGGGGGDPRSSRALGPDRNGEGRLNDSVAGLPHPPQTCTSSR